jgi:hypothetical protein
MAVEALLLEHRQDFLSEKIRTNTLPSLYAGWRLTKHLHSGEGQKQNEGRRLRHDPILQGENDVNMMSWGKSHALILASASQRMEGVQSRRSG